MASYRPKSLDELNNLYGKAVSAEKAIKKGTSLLGDDALSAPHDRLEEKTPAPASFEQRVESVSPDIDAFIRSFSSDEGRPVPLSRLTPTAEPQSEPSAAPKEEGITGLMDDYANVMTGAYDDEEEDDRPKKNRFKQRRGKRKSASKEIISDPLDDRGESFAADPEQGGAFSEFSRSNEAQLNAGASLFENDEAPAYTPTYEQPRAAESDLSDGADDEADDVPFERDNLPGESFEFGEIAQKQRLSGGKLAAKIFMTVLLVLILFATAATGACVLTVNSGKEIGGYYAYTVENTDAKSGISADDLVLCKKAEAYQKDANVVYYDINGQRAVGQILIANGNGTYNINISDVQQERVEGVAEKSIGSLGKIAKLVSNSFMVILVSLVAAAIIITLLLCFAFKPKASAGKARREGEHSEPEGEKDPLDDDELFSGIE